MGTNEPRDMFGVDAYVLGLKVVFWAYALMIGLKVVAPALGLVSAASSTGIYSGDAAQGFAAIVLIVAAILLFVGLFFATFLFVSAHNVDVILTSSVGAGEPFRTTTSANPEVGGGVAVVPELFFPPDLAPLVYLLPPVLLLYAGYREWHVEGDPVAATTKVIAGYGIVALGTIVPVAWLFNSVVASFVADLASSPMVETTVRLEYPNLVTAHLLVGVIYPLVFGGAGAMAGKLTGDSREPASPGRPETERREPNQHGDWQGQRGQGEPRRSTRQQTQQGYQQTQQQGHHQNHRGQDHGPQHGRRPRDRQHEGDRDRRDQ